MMSGMAEGMYRLHYHEKISDNLSSECKLDVLNRISDLTLRSPIWMDRDKDYREDFPEIAPYVSKGATLSGLYLVAIMKGLLSDVQRGN